MNTTWHETNNTLTKEFIFPTFADAIAFINKVAAIATELNHHPEILNTYTKVTLTLSTHDAGDIVTDRDREFAARVDMF
jgi:4a-hydroxytetrahydrobiopterin dehydratase